MTVVVEEKEDVKGAVVGAVVVPMVETLPVVDDCVIGMEDVE